MLAQILTVDPASKPARKSRRRRRAVVTLAVVGGLLGTGGVAAAAAGVSYRSVGGALTGDFADSQA